MVPPKLAIKTDHQMSGADGAGGGGRSTLCGAVMPGAVVLTLTETAVAELSLVVTVPGDTLQAASLGAPAQVRLTEALNPGVAAKLKL